MGLSCWDGGILGRDMGTTLMVMITRVLISELRGELTRAPPNSVCDVDE